MSKLTSMTLCAVTPSCFANCWATSISNLWRWP
ncbi:Uncharacterised protein [Vibrio cholerae]|nr:Uncharacterised protein [Vibrio cholerae]